jgi:hypothetical protein
MNALYYTISQRANGWHVHPTDRNDAADDRLFSTHDEAVAWVRSIGGIPQSDHTEAGVTIAPEHAGIGEDVVSSERSPKMENL